MADHGRLIDADALLKRTLLKNPDAKFHCAPVEDIEAAPTIEAKKRGKWIYPHETTTLVSICSKCGSHGRGNSCPNCGADMREVDG